MGSNAYLDTVPFLLMVPSTFRTLIGFSSGWVGSLCCLTNCWSIKVPAAPESRRAFVSTFCFPSCCSHKIEIGRSRDLFSISATSTEDMMRGGLLRETDIDFQFLGIKNPDWHFS